MASKWRGIRIGSGDGTLLRRPVVDDNDRSRVGLCCQTNGEPGAFALLMPAHMMPNLRNPLIVPVTVSGVGSNKQ